MTIVEKPLPPTPVLETERLILRPLVPADAPIIQRRFPRWGIVRYLDPSVRGPIRPTAPSASSRSARARWRAARSTTGRSD